ncbi:phage portal protein [Kribbella sp. CA-293567]|uniref:phage portal protein n=1 Tax=Kribbella sp. CA-293567 TaxID=3002436 RepID=UPI0022DD7BA0|nr:phage portal protein [Kribbella sp. CA-293567]WBQ03013.1 phage portal protein [Kribbella sp. CA-293567]
MASVQEALRLLGELADELQKRQPDIRLFDAYYRGEHNLAYASDQFRGFFANRYKDFSDNWCGVVADAPTERLELIGIRPKGGGKKAGDKLWATWLENDADALSDLAFIDAIIAKRAYALVWGDPDTDDATITWEHPSQAIVGYHPETRRRRAGLKLWADEKLEYATLYLRDEVWKWQRSRTQIEKGRTQSGLYIVGSLGGWEKRKNLPEGEPWPLPNPLGEVPLVELPNRPRLIGEPLSDIAGTVAMQNATNLFWSYLLNAGDFTSFPQRVIMGQERPEVPVLDKDGQETGTTKPLDLAKFSVERVVWLEDPEAKISEWSATNLEQYTKVIEVQVGHIAAQTRTPQHYLIGKMSNLSADALKAAETGLVKRTEEKTEHFGRAIREVFRLVALVQGDEKRARAVAAGEVLWRDVESRSDAQRADALLKKKTIGYPFEWLAEQDGNSPTEVARIMEMRRAELNDETLNGLLKDPAGDDVDREPEPSPDASVRA